jgi:hypothetical protein
MATKICIAPYVRGPEIRSDVSNPTPVRGWKGWCTKMRTIARALLTPPIVAAKEPHGHWAYRVVNSRRSPAADESRHCQRKLRLAVEVSDFDLEAIAPAQLQPGDLIVVEAGQTVFADGTILAGIASIDESAITGHSEPLVCSAESRPRIMRDSCVIAGQILVRVADRRGHPLDWIETPTEPRALTQSALRSAAVRP